MLKYEASEKWPGNLWARLPGWCLLLGLFSLACGAKMWLIHYFGNATPFRDEWDVEAPIIKGSLAGTLSPMQFFALQNEHRVAFTRILVLLLTRANSQWDPMLQMVAQAVLHVVAIVAFVYLAGKSMRWAGKAALAAFAAWLSLVPFGWDNTLQGEDSVYYFSILFGLVVIRLCWRHEALTWKWWIGALTAFACLFTTAGGIFPIAAVTAFLTFRLVLEKGKPRTRRIAGIAILGAIIAFGVAITPRNLHPQDVAPNIKAFLSALTGILSWPCGFHWAWWIIQAPLMALTILCLYRRTPFTDGRWFPIIVGATFWIQAVVTAYKRCKDWEASRYSDFWVMLLLAVCACLFFLIDSFGQQQRRRLIYPMVSFWFLACLYGTLDSALNTLPKQLMSKRASTMEMENNLREYLRTGDTNYLKGNIPYPKADLLEKRLDSNILRALLPSNLINPNPPLPVVVRQSPDAAFAQDGCANGVAALGKPVFGSYGADGARSKGSISLRVAIPKGTRELELQVAGYPSSPGMELTVREGRQKKYSIAPAIDPGLLWETVSFRLKTKCTSLRIDAADKSEWAWLAFSTPAVSNQHTLGRWANAMADSFMEMFVIGLVLMLAGALMAPTLMPTPSPDPDPDRQAGR